MVYKDGERYSSQQFEHLADLYNWRIQKNKYKLSNFVNYRLKNYLNKYGADDCSKATIYQDMLLPSNNFLNTSSHIAENKLEKKSLFSLSRSSSLTLGTTLASKFFMTRRFKRKYWNEPDSYKNFRKQLHLPSLQAHIQNFSIFGIKIILLMIFGYIWLIKIKKLKLVISNL